MIEKIELQHKIPLNQSVGGNPWCYKQIEKNGMAVYGKILIDVDEDYFKTHKTLEVPKKITLIDGNSFLYINQFVNIKLPDSITEIGSKAFNNRNCNVHYLTIGKNVKKIGEGCFKEAKFIILRVKKNSVAHKYAIENKIPYVIY